MDDLVVALNGVQLNLQPPSLPLLPLAKVDRLPVELLVDIFFFCAHQDALSTVFLSQVSTRWRAILAHEPRIYQVIVLDDTKHSLGLANSLAHHCLVRSRPLPFDVHLAIASHDTLLPFLSPFLQLLPRWRSCHVEGVKTEDVRFADLWNEEGPPSADQLDISIVDASARDPGFVNDFELDDDEEPEAMSLSMFRQNAMPLASNLLYMELACGALPRPIHVTPLNFASLVVTEASPSLSLSPANLLRFLCACPTLEFFQFTGIMNEPEISPTDAATPPPIVPLLRLRSLVLHSTLCTRILLSFIHAPNLRELYLEHLNVDWQFPVHNPYIRRESTPIAVPPPSSSSSSFSSSSWNVEFSPFTATSLPSEPPPVASTLSMHPTISSLALAPPSPFGQGTSQSSLLPDALQADVSWPASPMPSIRSPVTPITIPPEPFADCEYEDGDSDDEFPDFSQSPYSDHATGMGVRSLLRRSSPPLRVLEMDYADMRTKDFRWLFQRVPTLEEFRIVASDMADRVVRMLAPQSTPQGVLLPRMRSLELVNCHRLSGDAILEAVKGRVIVTDGAARRGDLEPVALEDVAIIGCNNFTPEHGEELHGLLNDRLRL